MKARLKSGKIITGKLAVTFVKKGLAKEVIEVEQTNIDSTLQTSEKPAKKLWGNIQNLKNQKKKV